MLPNTTTKQAPTDHAGRIKNKMRTVVHNRMKEAMIEEIREDLKKMTAEEQRELLRWMRKKFQQGQKEKLGIKW